MILFHAIVSILVKYDTISFKLGKCLAKCLNEIIISWTASEVKYDMTVKSNGRLKNILKGDIRQLFLGTLEYFTRRYQNTF